MLDTALVKVAEERVEALPDGLALGAASAQPHEAEPDSFCVVAHAVACRGGIELSACGPPGHAGQAEVGRNDCEECNPRSWLIIENPKFRPAPGGNIKQNLLQCEVGGSFRRSAFALGCVQRRATRRADRPVLTASPWQRRGSEQPAPATAPRGWPGRAACAGCRGSAVRSRRG